MLNLMLCISHHRGFSGGSVVKNLPTNVGDTGDAGSIPMSGRSPGGGNGNPLQWVENSMDRRTWWATALGIAKSQAQLSELAQRQT